MHESGTLRPPSATERHQRQVFLERLNVEHGILCPRYGCRPSYHLDDSLSLSVAELAQFCQENSIPYGALLVTVDYDGGHGLDWSHLTLCECREWFAGSLEAHLASDYHGMIMLSRQWRPSEEQLTRVRELCAEESAA